MCSEILEPRFYQTPSHRQCFMCSNNHVEASQKGVLFNDTKESDQKYLSTAINSEKGKKQDKDSLPDNR